MYGGVKALVEDSRVEIKVSRSSNLGKKLAQIGAKFYEDKGVFVVGNKYPERYDAAIKALKAHHNYVGELKKQKKEVHDSHIQSAKNIKTGKYGKYYLFRPSFFTGFVITLVDYDKDTARELVEKHGAYYVAATRTYHFGIEKEDLVRCLLEL